MVRPFHSINRAAASVAGSTAAAVLCAVLTQARYSRQSELYSDLLCWATLPLFLGPQQRWGPRNVKDSESSGTLLPKRSTNAGPKTSKLSAWAFAACIAILCYWTAENGATKLFPALTPLILYTQNRLVSKSLYPSASGPWIASPSAWGPVLIATFSSLTFSNWEIRAAARSIPSAAALAVLFAALLPGTKRWFIPRVNLTEAIIPISVRAVVLLTIVLGLHTAVFGLPEMNVASVVILGIAKAQSWLFMSRAAQHTSWRIATTIGTFAIASTCNPFLQQSETQAVSYVLTSLLALGQTIRTLPKQTRASPALWGFALVSLGPYIASILSIRVSNSMTSFHHPVENLIRNAQEVFEDLLERQSKTYAAAHGEYQRRYGVEPPPGFQGWYEFAVSRQSPIIDDFDTILEGISPLWKLSGQEVLRAMNESYNERGSDLWLCEFSGGTGKTRTSHRSRLNDRHFGYLFNTLLGDLPGFLPDVKFLINHLDEPSLLIPPHPTEEGADPQKQRVNVTRLSKEPVWSEITRFCEAGLTNEGPSFLETFGLPLAIEAGASKNGLALLGDVKASKDLCRHPEYSTSYGLVMRPSSFQLIEGAVPILSVGTLSTMSDILFPSPAYIEDEFRYDATSDLEWEKKRDNVYWAGSTTGGFAADDQWRNYQRQRFVGMAQNLEQKRYDYLRDADGLVHLASWYLNPRLFDVAFTRISGCETKYCRDQEAYFHLKGWAHKDEALHSKLVFDLDGNGISGRYYKLLASRSAPLKQTLLKEWHDERLVPWLHYIPISQGMQEVPDLVNHLLTTATGQESAMKVAEAGRKWFSEAMREDDLRVYVYRLLLELARLQDPNRLAGQPEGKGANL
ncbi:related to capsule-associated protein [Cephalotrichum gorgonifer]|uniref:Related to capsule-associated protein n=1 Tax=Cephalotrichum gorgonifer TaxID=2041049 RepID=A0AAE8N4I4_9PEZI|nr:related to capsule-associated protein [Cephalotrichum gorgonifer]